MCELYDATTLCRLGDACDDCSDDEGVDDDAAADDDDDDDDIDADVARRCMQHYIPRISP